MYELSILLTAFDDESISAVTRLLMDIAIRVALGVSKRRDVILPTVSWISTASSAALAGGNVKFADVKNPTVCVDVASIKNLVTEYTAAVVVVHLFGRPVDGLG